MSLPQESKIWIFQAIRDLNGDEINEIEQTLDRFFKDWNDGNTDLASYAIPYNRFIVVAADESLIPASSCSADGLIQLIKGFEVKFNLGFSNHNMVSYSLNEEIYTIPLEEFKQKFRNGEIPNHASIFHNGVRTLAEFEEAWELPLSESWVSVLLNK